MEKLTETVHNVLGWFKQRKLNKELKKEYEEEQAKRNTKRFIKAQEIDYKLNKKIAEIREWKSVGTNDFNSSEVEGLEIWKMNKEQLITSLCHCYRTLRAINEQKT